MKKIDSDYDVLFEKLTCFLELYNYKKTPERFAILRAIVGIGGPFEVKNVFLLFVNNKYFISKATLYNTIHLFENCGIIQKVFIKDKLFYQLCPNCSSYFINNQNEKKSIIIDERIERDLISFVEEKYKVKIKRLYTEFYI